MAKERTWQAWGLARGASFWVGAMLGAYKKSRGKPLLLLHNFADPGTSQMGGLTLVSSEINGPQDQLQRTPTDKNKSNLMSCKGHKAPCI